MTNREELQEKLLVAILRAIGSEVGDTIPVSMSVYSTSEELAKMVVDENLGPNETEDEMEELCADMDNFAKED